MQTMIVQARGDEVSVIVRGFSCDVLQERALGECGRVFGDCPFQLTRADVVPCMVSAGGRVRLFEGRFSACRASESAATAHAV
jgi:hypothetical protein